MPRWDPTEPSATSSMPPLQIFSWRRPSLFSLQMNRHWIITVVNPSSLSSLCFTTVCLSPRIELTTSRGPHDVCSCHQIYVCFFNFISYSVHTFLAPFNFQLQSSRSLWESSSYTAPLSLFIPLLVALFTYWFRPNSSHSLFRVLSKSSFDSLYVLTLFSFKWIEFYHFLHFSWTILTCIYNLESIILNSCSMMTLIFTFWTFIRATLLSFMSPMRRWTNKKIMNNTFFRTLQWICTLLHLHWVPMKTLFPKSLKWTYRKKIFNCWWYGWW